MSRRRSDTRRRRVTALFLLASAACLACGSEDQTQVGGPGPVEPAPGEDVDVAGEAILVSAFVRTPDSRNIYVGAVSELPGGDLDYARFLEFGNVDVFTFGGYVFVWDRDPAIMTRFSVEDDLSLVEGPRVSLTTAVPGVGRHVFISETRAYTLSTSLDSLAIWNPSTMELVSVVPLDPPAVAEGLLPNVGLGALAGDRVIWPVEWGNTDALTVRQTANVIIASATSDEAPTFVEDTRCTGATGGRFDENGDYYLYALAGTGRYAAYGEAAAQVRTCVLRVNADTSEFDPEFIVDLRDLTGTYVNRGLYHVQGSQYLTYVWDSANAMPEGWLDYNGASTFQTLLIDIATNSVTPYPHVLSGPVITSFEYSLDGVAYHQQSANRLGSGIGSITDVVELDTAAAPRRFTINPGSLWSLGRIR